MKLKIIFVCAVLMSFLLCPKLEAQVGIQCAINGLSTTTGLAWDYSNNTIWAAISGGNYVAHIDQNCNILARVSVGRYPFGVTWDGHYIWVTNYEDNTVTKINSATSAVVGTYTVGSHPRGVILDTNYIFVANQGSNTVTKLDEATGTVLATIHVGSAPYSLVNGGSSFWVGNTGSNTVMEIDLNGNILQTLTTCNDPAALSIGIGTGAQTLWVSCYNSAVVAAYTLTNPASLLGTVSTSNYGHSNGIFGLSTSEAYVVTHSGYFLDIKQQAGTGSFYISNAIPLETGSQTHLFNIIQSVDAFGQHYWIDDVDAARIIKFNY